MSKRQLSKCAVLALGGIVRETAWDSAAKGFRETDPAGTKLAALVLSKQETRVLRKLDKKLAPRIQAYRNKR